MDTPHKKTVLVIDDDPQMHEIYKEALETDTLQMMAAEDGAAGIEMAKKSKPDLILLDIMLASGLNGFDVLEQLKRDPAVKGIPVIVLTNLDSERKTALEIGAADYIVKANIALDELVSKIMGYL